MKKNTFSYKVKQELCKIENHNTCCDKAQSYAMLLFFRFFQNNGAIQSENAQVLRNLSENLTALTACISEVQVQYLRKIYVFVLLNQSDRNTILEFYNFAEKISEEIFQCANCRASFLRGAFLACAVVLDPKKQYKCEFVVSQKDLAKEICEFINEILGMNFKISERKNKFIVYTKDSSKIEDFLTFIGAKNASMEFMQEKMYKELINNINRKSNFETANIDKTISAAARQIAAIAKIYDNCEEDFLKEDLKQIAQFRLENQEMSLAEMAKNLGISRSAVNHKLNKIISLAEKI